MASFNKVILIGNMTADPELNQTQGGISVCSFNIAVNRKYNKDGNNEVDFITIQTWRQQAEFVSKYFKKGKPILVCGQLQTRSWTDKQGNKRYATEVVADEVSFVGSNENATETKSEASTASNQPYVPSTYTQPQFNAPVASAQFEEIPDDSQLPF
jgi:single-strand DNA-binding protein